MHAHRCIASEVGIEIGGSRVVAELALNGRDREKGLMGRRKLAENHGMLFVFARPGIYSFWMKDTLIPLSVAFIDENGRVINIEEMAPLTYSLHYPVRKAKYALEMRSGWFAGHHVEAGSVARIPPLGQD